MRSYSLCLLGLPLAAAAFWILSDPASRTRGGNATASAVSSTARDLRAIQRQLDEVKQVLGEIRAENADLKARVRALLPAMARLAGGKPVKPTKPSVSRLPEPLPDLKPFPR
jgi:hypothetical protein